MPIAAGEMRREKKKGPAWLILVIPSEVEFPVFEVGNMNTRDIKEKES